MIRSSFLNLGRRNYIRKGYAITDMPCFKGKQTTADHDGLRVGGTLHAGIQITKNSKIDREVLECFRYLLYACTLGCLLACKEEVTCTTLSLPQSTTYTTSSMVRLVSAMLVAMTILRTPEGGLLKACR